MKLAAVFNIWADCACIFPYAIENIRPVVDDIIVVWSKKSNRGQVVDYVLPDGCQLVQCEPVAMNPHVSETAKRNAGLEAAKKIGATHFIMLDGDEFYEQKEFLSELCSIQHDNLAGTVCKVKTYFKSPTLTIGYDHTLVPFIHKLTPDLQYHMNFKYYPFAVDSKGTSFIDCTRRLNIKRGVQMADITMHHYSYCRKDISLKLQNSSANFKALRATMVYDDLKNAKPGYFLRGFQRELKECDNIFNLPEFAGNIDNHIGGLGSVRNSTVSH